VHSAAPECAQRGRTASMHVDRVVVTCVETLGALRCRITRDLFHGGARNARPLRPQKRSNFVRVRVYARPEKRYAIRKGGTF
jgi:hypothetical protein